MLLVGAESLIPLPYSWCVNRSISIEDWDKHKPWCKRWGAITTLRTCFMTVCPVPSPYLSSLPFFHCYFHHLCLSRNHYKLISCKWSRPQTWGRVGAWCQSAFTNLHPTSDPTAAKDWLSGGQNCSLSQEGHKCHVPGSLSYAEGMYHPNSHILQKMNVSSYFFDYVSICYVTDIVQSQRSSQLRQGEEKISEDLQSSSRLYKPRVSNSTLFCNKYLTLILILRVGEKKIDLNLNPVHIFTSNLNVSRKNILLARSVWANYCFYAPITQPALSLVSSTKIAVLYCTLWLYSVY